MTRTLAAILAAPERDRPIAVGIGLVLSLALIIGSAAMWILDRIGA